MLGLAGHGLVQPAKDAGRVLSEHLAGVAALDALTVAGGGEQARQRFTELRRDRGRSLCGAQRSHEIAHALTIPSQAGHAVLEQRAPSYVVRDERVAIP